MRFWKQHSGPRFAAASPVSRLFAGWSAGPCRSRTAARDPGCRDDAALESRLDVKVWRLLMRSGLPKPVRQHPGEVEEHYHEPLQRLVRQQQS